MFSGIGGIRLGLERASKEFIHVWSNDINRYATRIYRKNFGAAGNIGGDIRHINPNYLPDFELLTGGFPCQSFSQIGKRMGFQDTRGTLFYEICRIAKTKKPSLLLLENVKGLLTNDKGKTFQTILESLDELGYDAEWQVLNSKCFGVPQSRERVYIVGHLRGKGQTPIFPIEDNELNFEVDEKVQYAPTLTASYSGDGYGSGRPYLFYGDEMCSFTPKEFERLQGFPDDWTRGILESKRFEVLGNAVSVPVIEFLGKRLLMVRGWTS